MNRSASMLACAAVLAVWAGTVLSVHAQVGVPIPPGIAWERVALPEDIYARRDAIEIGFCGDSLFVIDSGLYQIVGGGPNHPASAGTWVEVNRTGGFDGGCRGTSEHRALYWNNVSILFRSFDGGRTSERVLIGGDRVPIETQYDELVGRFDAEGYGVCRTRNGTDWLCAPNNYTFAIYDFAVPRPGGPIPEGYLLANGIGGPSYSPDGGTTWLPSDLSQAWGPFGPGLAVIDGGPLHGTAVAVARLTAEGSRIYQSTDGQSWTDVGLAPICNNVPGNFRLLAIPGGLVVAYNACEMAYVSGDGGRTWALLFDVDGPLESHDNISGMTVGPDGYLYAAVRSHTQDAEERGGVYRTSIPLAVVAAAPAPSTEAARLAVAVHPTPTAGGARAVVTLVEPGGLRLDVLDRSGRLVATLYDGAAAAGRTAVEIETGGWAAGHYFVRAVALGRQEVTRLVVAP